MKIDLTPEELIAAASGIEHYYDHIKNYYTETGIKLMHYDMTINHIRANEEAHSAILDCLRDNGYVMFNRDLKKIDISSLEVKSI